MRYLFLGLCLFFLTGLTPIYDKHENNEQIDEEFRNLYLNVQPIQFEIVNSTPSGTQYKDGQMVIVSTTTMILMLTRGSTVYQMIFEPVIGK